MRYFFGLIFTGIARIILPFFLVPYVFAGAASAQETRVFDAMVFEESIKKHMENAVMGYAFVVADRNGIVGKVSGGYAQAPGDGNLPMKTFIPANAGSVAKMMSGTALLDMLEQHMVTPLSVTSQLNTPMMFYVPDKWVTVYRRNNPALGRITLRNLLNHRSGLAQEFREGGNHGTKIARALAQGVNENAIGRGNFDYNNNNYTLLLYIIAAIAYPDEIDTFERANENTPLAEYNRRAARTYGSLYERYIRQRFLPKTIVGISPTCRPRVDIANGQYAKEYASRNDTRGETDNPSFCRSQGSWFFSAQDLAQFARTLELTEGYLDDETRVLLLDDSDINNRLIYSRTFSPGNLRFENGGQQLPGHGGATRGHRAVLLRLPFGHVGVGMVTSRERGPGSLGSTLVNSFYDATRKWDEYNSDRPGSDFRNFDLSRPDPTLCRNACDGDQRCAAWTFVKPNVQGQQARCWLKTRANARRANNCCASGVKGIIYGVDRPGGDYRRVSLNRSDAALCQDLCGRDEKCRAWTFVKAGVQEDSALCWLKDKVRSPQRNNCCASGLKP